MSTIKKCLNCSKNIDSSGKALQCDSCCGFIHHNCADIPLDDIQRFTRSRAKGFRFVCKSCAKLKPRNSNNVSDDIFFNDKLSGSTSLISSEQNIDTSNINLGEIKNLLTDLRNSISNINERLSRLESQIVKSDTLSDNTFEDVVNETLERISREKNVMVAGVPEDINCEEVVENIIKTTCGNTDNTLVVKAYRVGHKKSIKPRLIKIELSSKKDAIHVLKNKNKLQNSIFKNYKLKGDETLRQRNYLKTLRTELNSRLDRGEVGLTIKYFRGVPKIIAQDTTTVESDST